MSINVDQAELDKFEKLAHRWWDPNSEFKPLHDINPLRLDYIEQRLGLQDKRVLDVGCGGGILAESMARRGAQVTGIDLGEAPLNVAQLHALESGVDVEYQQIAVEALAEERAGEYDSVTCMEMLEHVPDPGSIIEACSKLCKAGGKLFFSTLNRNPKSYLFAIVGAEQILKLLPKGTHEYKKFIRPSELANWCRRADIRVEDITGMSYNPLTRNYNLGLDIDVNYILHASKPRN